VRHGDYTERVAVLGSLPQAHCRAALPPRVLHPLHIGPRSEVTRRLSHKHPFSPPLGGADKNLSAMLIISTTRADQLMGYAVTTRTVFALIHVSELYGAIYMTV